MSPKFSIKRNLPSLFEEPTIPYQKSPIFPIKRAQKSPKEPNSLDGYPQKSPTLSIKRDGKMTRHAGFKVKEPNILYQQIAAYSTTRAQYILYQKSPTFSIKRDLNSLSTQPLQYQHSPIFSTKRAQKSLILYTARALTQDEVNAKGRAVQDACLFKQSESRKGFSTFARVLKQKNR